MPNQAQARFGEANPQAGRIERKEEEMAWDVYFTVGTEHGLQDWSSSWRSDLAVEELVSEVLVGGDCDGCAFDTAFARNAETGAEVTVFRNGDYEVASCGTR